MCKERDYSDIQKREEFTFRFSVEEDIEQIHFLIESCFGNRDSTDVYENLAGRYYVAVNQDKRIVAMTGLIDSKIYRGLEVDWTCLAKEYEHRGIITNMLGYLIRDVNEDIYCSCWRWRDKQINLKSVMSRLEFKPVLEPHLTYNSVFMNCKDICVAYSSHEEECVCYEDLYVKKGNELRENK